MTIAVSSSAVHKLALELISQEVRSTRGVKNSSGAEAGQHLDDARDARNRLLPLLQSAAELCEVDLILRIERGFLAEELEHLAKRPRKVASLNRALDQLDAAMNLLPIIRKPSTYKCVSLGFTLPRNRIYGMPRDEAQQFFISHAARLRNLGDGRFEDAEDELLDVRLDNIKKAQKMYTELQRQVLAPHEVREERALYLVA